MLFPLAPGAPCGAQENGLADAGGTRLCHGMGARLPRHAIENIDHVVRCRPLPPTLRNRTRTPSSSLDPAL